ncbi:MAG TPA: hypothetical protein VFV07_00480 [Rhizomicrobium sp.]|nr:hypothetical protein [Rhizomicrobium sp.]
MDRIPRAHELTLEEMSALRRVVANSFTPGGQINRVQRERLLELGLISSAMGGLVPTPAGRILARR